jgi:hypothetical protein
MNEDEIVSFFFLFPTTEIHNLMWFSLLALCLCRYISALLDDGEQASLQQAVDHGWPASLHLIGKV